MKKVSCTEVNVQLSIYANSICHHCFGFLFIMPLPLIGGALSDDAVRRLTSDVCLSVCLTVCLSVWCLSVTRPCYSLATYLRQSLTSTCLLTYILRALFCEVTRPKLTVHFIYRTVYRHGYEDATIQYPRTSKNTTTLLNFPYILPHIQSHSSRAPWPSPPAFCGLVLPVNQYVVASPA